MNDISVLEDRTGTDTVQLSHRDGRVIMHFERPVSWCALDAPTAQRFAEACARAAYAALAGDTPTPRGRSQLTDQIRIRLTQRVELMLGSFDREAPRPDARIQAARIVDTVLKEVL